MNSFSPRNYVRRALAAMRKQQPQDPFYLAMAARQEALDRATESVRRVRAEIRRQREVT